MIRRRTKPQKIPDMTERCLHHIVAMQAAIDFRQVVNIADLSQRIARVRQRGILIHSGTLPSYIMGGWTEIEENYDLILVTTTADEQKHIILHKLSHMWCGHAANACGDLTLSSLFRFHDIAQMTVAMHCRSRMNTATEQEAETLATLLDRTRHAGPVVLDPALVSDEPAQILSHLAVLKDLSAFHDKG